MKHQITARPKDSATKVRSSKLLLSSLAIAVLLLQTTVVAQQSVPSNPLRPVARHVAKPKKIALAAYREVTNREVTNPSAVQQASAQDPVDIPQLTSPQSQPDWDQRRNVPGQLPNAQIQQDGVRVALEPIDDPFGDSILRKKGIPSQFSGFKSLRPQEGNGGNDEIKDFQGAGGNKNPETLPEPKLPNKLTDDEDLPPQDRTFQADCDKVASQIASSPIHLISLNLAPIPKADSTIPYECPLTGYGTDVRCWTPQTFTFTASNLCHKPLYFQDIQLERYGHSRGPILQPFASAAHFFGNIAILPYNTGVYPPNECRYALGYYRPGDCAPWLRTPLPISRRGMLYQAGFVTGATLLLP